MKRQFFYPAIICTGAFLLVSATSCNNSKKEVSETGRTYFDSAGMDSTVRPGDNFFLYANGKWLKTAEIPGDQSAWGSFYTLYEDNLQKLRGLLEDAAKSNSAKGSIEQKLGDYYASGMDTATINKLGAAPLKEGLAKIEAVKNYRELMDLVAGLYAVGEDYLIGMQAGADDKNSSRNIAQIYQSGTSLPEKEYYTRKDSASIAARKALVTFAEKLFVLSGTAPAEASKKAQTILSLEGELAKTQRSPVELRDPHANYNKMSIGDLEKLSPNVGWKNLFEKLNIKTDSVIVGQPGYYQGLSKLLASQPIENWKTKLAFDYISSHANLLGRSFTDATFTFDQTFNGQKTESERWKTMTNRLDGGLGELLGQLYVKKYFNDTAKQRMDELVNNLQKAFENRLRNLDWMSQVTRERAITKLNTFVKKIGHPANWKNYDDVVIDRNNFFASSKSIRLHNRKENIAKIGQPVDRLEWHMSPPTVNAYYNSNNNEIVFPAGILQFPFFDATADDAINYGAIGMVIGHEMTHGFDDQGCQYDEKGNMKNWWSSQDSSKFKSKTGGIVKQYNAYTVLNDQHVNGELTLGENIADIGGLAIAYDAFKMTKQGKDTGRINGFTPDQRFFLGYAQAWRMKSRDEVLRTRLSVDPHSPEMFRVNGPSANFEPFYTTFNVQPGDKMYIQPDERAHIW